MQSGIFAVIVISSLLIFAGCDQAVNPEDENREMSRVELEIRETSEVVATWTSADGWDVDKMQPIPSEGGGSETMWADGPPAVLNVRIYDADGNQYQMGTVEHDEDTGMRECTEYSARYTIAPGSPDDVIAWPPMMEGGSPSHFAERRNGERVSLFNCDHIRIYAEMECEPVIQIQLWNEDRVEAQTTPLEFTIEPPRGG